MIRKLIILAVLAGAAHISSPALAGDDTESESRYLIEFADPGMLEFHRGRDANRRFDARSAEVAAYRDQLIQRHADFKATMSSLVGREVEVSHYFLATHSGMAATLSAAEAARVASLPEVVSVEPERFERLDTHRGPTFIGADAIWDGSAVPGGVGNRGQGMVIGVLDGGTVLPHPSFADDAVCGHGTTFPPKMLSVLDCASTDVTGLCNGPDPADTDGHGSHTASTAGGNTIDQSVSPPPAFPSISGVAPCASLRTYKVCPANTCPGADIQAGMNSILLHGDVDVMNFSISGGQSPWTDNDRRKLDLVDAGIVVAASAGNTRAETPDPVGAVNHRGPWVMSVANSSHDEAGASGVLSASGPGTPPAPTQDIAMDRGNASPNGTSQFDLPIRHFTGQPATSEGCTPGEDGVDPGQAPFPAGFFNGSAALIHRGSCSFVKKITNAFNAGAEFVIIRNNTTTALSMATPGQPPIPAYSIEQAPGDALVAFVDANPTTATVDINIFPIPGDALSTSSLRGPTAAPLQHLQKPNITGPGTNIYAVTTDASGYGFLSGTSMSSPHLAGAATLIRAVQPTWTAPEVVSAIQMTAKRDGLKDDLETPWDWDDVGSGRIDLTRAALAGLVMHETTANFLASDPGAAGDVRTLNLPSVRDRDCTAGCSFTRTVRSTLTGPMEYDVTVDLPVGFNVAVTPSNFTLAAGATQELTITITPEQPDRLTFIQFGAVNIEAVAPTVLRGASLPPPSHITIAVQGDGADPLLNDSFE